MSFKPIADDDRLVYFATYTNASLGRVKNLYLDWARVNGPLSRECKELNHLFSTCVDGNRIQVPEKLKSPAKPPDDAPPFVLDVLHDASKLALQQRTKQVRALDYDGLDVNGLEVMINSDETALTEFELIKLTVRWCYKYRASLDDFIDFFDFNNLSAEEKAWTLGQLPCTIDYPSLVMNSLCQSSLLDIAELRPFKLHYSGFHWKRYYDSTNHDRLATFPDSVAKALTTFHRKLLVFKVDDRLSFAIYVPQKMESGQECVVGDTMRLFAFPHSSDKTTASRLSLPTKKNYRLYCDEDRFQLYEGQQQNTWIQIIRDFRARNRPTDQSQPTHGCRTSVALGKFSRGLSDHIGRVQKNIVLGAVCTAFDESPTLCLADTTKWLTND